MTVQSTRSDSQTAVPEPLAALLARQSTANLVSPGPTDDQLALILASATTVPDHGQLVPWRLVVVRDEAREVFGDALAAAGREAMGDEGAKKADKLRGKAFLAPALIVLIASPSTEAKVPVWEQTSSASCTGYAIALAAHYLGLGAVWKSAPFLDGAALRTVLGLVEGEQVLGWVNVGTVREGGEPQHARPQLTDVVTEVDAALGRVRSYLPAGAA
jgi:nitroreductase